jgi:hypothetical protein
MTFAQIETLISETVELIAVNSHSLAEAKPRASRFLVVNALLSSFLKDIEEELPKLQTLEDAEYAQALSVAGGGTITEKKVNVALVKSYTDVRENKEKLQALRSWILNHIKIFENAHVMFRQYSRD